jgi:hypothetical protein
MGDQLDNLDYGRGGMASDPQGGLSRAFGVGGKILGTLGKMAVAGYTSGRSQNPWAGPQALAQLQQQGMAREAQFKMQQREQELIKYMQANHTDMSTPEKRNAAVMGLVRLGANKKAMEMSTIFQQQFGDTQVEDPYKYAPVKSIHPETGEDFYASRQQAIGEGLEPAATPPAVQIINEADRLKGAQADIELQTLDELKAELGDDALARDLRNKAAFREEGLGVVIRGSIEAKKMTRSAIQKQEEMSKLYTLIDEIAAEYGTTHGGSALRGFLESYAGTANPLYRAYQAAITRLAVATVSSEQDRISDVDITQAKTRFPTFQELIEDGQISETALRVLRAEEEKAKSAYMVFVPKSQKELAERNWSTKFGGGDPGYDVEQVE